MELWNGLRPFHRLPSRLCKEWGEIGFQGQDPATDFRGMGMLGLEQLLYFTTKHNKTALKVLKLSQGDGSDLSGFPFAIVRQKRYRKEDIKMLILIVVFFFSKNYLNTNRLVLI